MAATTEGATWMFEQLRDLRDRYGYDVTAVVSGETGGLVDKLRSEGIPYYAWDFEFTGPGDIWTLPRKILGLAAYFRRQRFDVVHTHLFHSMVIGRIAAWLADVPIRLTMVAGPFHLEAAIPRWIDRSTCSMDTALIGSCQYTLDLYRSMNVPKERLALIYYGPDERKFGPEETLPAEIRREFGWESDTVVVGMIAYFYPRLEPSRWVPRAVHGHPIKGHEYLIRAVPKILAEFPTARLLLVGCGWGEAGDRHLEEMKALVRKLGLEEKVIFTGFRTDVNRILRALDVSVQPSLNENLGGTIESLLMECPTVATRVGGMVDSVRDGETGVLVEPANPDDLAQGILRILRDPDYARTLARAGHTLMLQRFTLSRTVDDLNQLYTRLYCPDGRRVAGYRSLVSLRRLLALAPLGTFLVVRLSIVETYLLPAWETGWRPWRLSGTRLLAARDRVLAVVRGKARAAEGRDDRRS